MGKQATREELGDLGVVYNRLFEFVKNGKRPVAQVIAGLQALADGKFPEEARYDRYNAMLLSVADQLARLRDYNKLYWDNVLTDEHFECVNWGPDGLQHEQQVDDLLLLYVDFGSPEATFEAWWKVLCGTQPGNYRWDQLRTDVDHLKLHSRTREYGFGIYTVHINLVAHWEPEDGRNVIQVREQAEVNDELLAHAEAMAAYGLHPELLQQQDGENLPYVDLAGYMADVPGHGAWRPVPYFLWYRDYRKVMLSAFWVDYSNRCFAAPVVWES